MGLTTTNFYAKTVILLPSFLLGDFDPMTYGSKTYTLDSLFPFI